MLNVMREIRGHWALKGLLLLVALSMVAYLGYYFADQSTSGPSGDWAAMVGDRRVGTREFQRVAQNLDRQYRSMFGDQYDQIKANLRLGSQALSTLVQRELMLQEAEKLGITASEREIQEAVLQDPTFQDAEGRFVGSERYIQAVQGFPGGAPAYERLLGEEIVIDKWRRLATEAAFVSERELEDAYRARTEKTAVEYAVVAAADQTPSSAVDESEIVAWYEDHRDDYLRDTARRIRYVVVSRQAQIDKVVLDDARIAEYYEANLDSYRHPAQRRARHILFRIPPDASDEDVAALRQEAVTTIRRLQAGMDFDELARALSNDEGSRERGGDLGWFAAGAMVPEFEEAVFSHEPGTLVDEPVKTAFGFHVIEVTGAREAGVAPLDEVRDDIRRQLAAREAQRLLREEADRIAARVTSPADLDTVATEEGLDVVEATVTASDRMPELAPSPEFREVVEGMDAGDVRGPLGVARGLAIVAVDEIIPATVAPLDEVRDSVRTAILNQRQRDAAVEAARRALDRRGSVEAAAKSLGVEVRESGDLAPGPVLLPGTGGGQEAMRDVLFADSIAEGDTGVVEVPAGAVMYRVTRRVPFDAELFEASRASLREELLNQRRGELLRSILFRVEKDVPIQVNDALVARYDG